MSRASLSHYEGVSSGRTGLECAHLSPSLKAITDIQGHTDAVERDVEAGR